MCSSALFLPHNGGSTECLLLAVMSFDHYVAICKPLHYTLIMNQRICILLVATVWLSGMTYALSEATVTLQLPLCVRNTLDHLLCEIPVLIKTACGEKGANELTLSVVCTFFFNFTILYWFCHISTCCTAMLNSCFLCLYQTCCI